MPLRARLRQVAPVPAPTPAPQPLPALIHTQPVRSGQRLYARDRDLIITASVGAAAEVMADGCVHIYGALRGRAMAGVRGDAGARVFIREFLPELVAVAGVFKVFEQLPADWPATPCRRCWTAWNCASRASTTEAIHSTLQRKNPSSD